MAEIREAADKVLAERFSKAIRGGDVAAMESLIAAGAEIGGAFNGEMPLCRAVANGHQAAAELLLSYGADIETMNWDGCTPLACAARGELAQSWPAIAEMLLKEGANAHAVDANGNSVLMHAALAGSTEIITMLLAQGADINHARGGGETALMHAAWNGKGPAVVLLIDNGANPAQENSEGEDAKCAAASMGHADIVNLITATVAAREERQTREKAEADFRRNLEGIVNAVQGGVADAVQVQRPLRLKAAMHA